MDIRVERIGIEKLVQLWTFVEGLDSETLKSFRYFDKRPYSVIQEHLVTLLAFDAATPIGYGHLDPDGETVWLGIAVKANYRGTGTGKRIMEELDIVAWEHGLERVRLSVDVGNEAAKGLYERFGFEVVKEKEGKIFMEKVYDVTT